jgi:hypothetical protein
MTPQPITVGDPVRLITRLRPPASIVPYLDGIVESIDGDRASVRWADGARSSSRLQFLDPSIGWYPRVVHILTQSADLHDRDRQPRREFNSGWAHLVADGQAGPDDGRPRMDPSELED